MKTFKYIEKRLKDVSKFADIGEQEIKLLLSHKRVKKTTLSIRGKGYEAWRIVHNDALGPGKGGIRFHPNVSEDEVKSLSFWMSLKNSLAGLPYGGAKGGIRIDPRQMTKKELEEVSRSYIRAFHNFIGENKDIPAPDVYTNAEIMGWMLDEYEKIEGRHEPGVITGKPIELGGCELRGTATSKGGMIILKEFLKKIGKGANEITIAIQGFGNAGMNIASMLYGDGFRIVAVSDSKGGVYNNSGLNIPEVVKTKKSEKTVTAYENGEKITNEKLLESDVDVLILAALENQITEENADRIKAKYILELANGPVTPEADDVLFGKGVVVIPDILANSGGVVVSYFEWVQNKVGNIFEMNYLDEKLRKIMTNSFNKVYDLFNKSEEMDMRKAAYIIAIKRILEAERARGNLE